MRKIYVASSWRNQHQNSVVHALKAMGHEVYDYKNPEPGNEGFNWSQIDLMYFKWTPKEFVEKALTHPIAKEGFKLDMNALKWCDTCILLLPCGRSAHLEAGYAVGAGKEVAVFISNEKFEPELMYLMCNLVTNKIEEIYKWVGDAK